MRAIISGGGSGGHVFPAIAIANEIKRMEPSAEILFVGAKGKIEMEKVPKAGYPIEGLWISGIDRKLTKRNLAFPFKLMSSLFKANAIINKFDPDVAIGVGGFASGPLLYMAAKKDIPTLIQEQNSYAGITNKLLAKEVDRICVAYEGMDKFFDKSKIVYTGNPVRKEIFDHDLTKESAKAKMDLDQSKKTVLVFGGSLGARTLNDAIANMYEMITAHTDVQWIWQVGKLYYEEFLQHPAAQLENVKMMAFIEDMTAAYMAADVVVCRAGALTISELQLVGKPAILVPSPNVAEDHQTKNAMALVEKDAAILVKDSEAKGQLVKEVLELLDDDIRQKELSSAILQLGIKNAARKIAEEIFEIAKK